MASFDQRRPLGQGRKLRIGNIGVNRAKTCKGAKATITAGDHPLRTDDIDKTPDPLDGLPRDKRPTLIRAGALGPDRPNSDLIVSPQHRILVGSPEQLATIFQAEGLAPAKALTALPGIRHMMGKPRITWVHFALERHEIVCANGCWTESLLLGPIVVMSLSTTDRDALRQIFPRGSRWSSWNGAPARRCLSVGDAHLAIAQAGVKRHKAKMDEVV